MRLDQHVECIILAVTLALPVAIRAEDSARPPHALAPAVETATTTAQAIDNTVVVVGNAFHAPSYSITNDINAVGQVAGSSHALGAYFYRGSEFQGMNAMIAPSGGWFLDNAYSINETGQITVSKRKDAEYYALLMDPVPEPSSIAMTLAAMLLLGSRAHRKRDHFRYRSSDQVIP